MLPEPTVFIVDDDPQVCDSVAVLVETMGLPTREFTSAEDFLAAYDPTQPGCLVTDLRMQGKSGLELQEQLKADEVRLPVVFITGYADVPTAVRIMQNGATSVLEKPFREQDLWDAIRKALDRDTEFRRHSARIEDVRQRLTALTDNERQVLDLLVAGKMNKTIAKQLGVSLRTVEQRRHDLLDKMQVDSLAALVRLSIEADSDSPV